MLTSSRAASDRLAWDAPATTISVAGVHGGAGATTMCLLLAHAITGASRAPALTVDLAGRSRGGLAVLGAAAAQSTAEAIAAVALRGAGVQKPFGVNDAGVRIIGAPPNGVEELDRTNETVVARIAHAVETGADDARVAQLARLAVDEDRTWQALRWDNDEVVDAVACVLDRAAPHHSLIAVDLGMIDSSQLGQMVEARCHLHVWVVPARSDSMEIAERRLPLVPFQPAGSEAIAVWQAEDRAPSTKRLSALGDRRGCPVVRIPHHGGAEGDWGAMVHECLSGIEELCGLAS
jgi:hypothetical protein